jgi:hypothetical protein
MPIAHAGGEAKGDQAASTKAILRQAQGLSPPLRVNARDHAVLYHRQSHALRRGDCRPRLRHAGQMTLDEITGDSPYGATTIAGGRGGLGCLNSFSASISGASAAVRLPSGVGSGVK